MRQAVVVGLMVVLLAPGAAFAQAFGPAHHVIAIVGPGSGAETLRAAISRRLLGLINDSSNVVYCTVDGTDAAANTGLRLNASGGSALFDRQVPTGPLKCYSATGGSRVLITEGR